MTVQELINELELVEDKEQTVYNSDGWELSKVEEDGGSVYLNPETDEE